MPDLFVFPRCKPEEQGISSGNIKAFVEAAEKSGLEMHGFMLLRHGKVVSEGFFKPYRADYQHSLFSLSKSFTSTAIGFATSEGLISLDDKVISFFPDQLTVEPDENLSVMEIRHLLSMATGHAEDTTGPMQGDLEGNWVKGFLRQTVQHEPGTHFLYNTGATYMLSAILRKVTGQNLLEYLTPRLFKPLGIEDPKWENCPMGTNVGGWGLSIKLEDIAKFGQLYLQKGQWLGKQLLPLGWVELASKYKVSNGDDPQNDWNQGYAYQFWRCRHNGFRGDGAFGQFCVVMPEKDMVFAAVSGLGDLQALLNLFWDIILLPISDSALPCNEKDNTGLQDKLATLAYPPLYRDNHSKLEDSLSGKRFRLDDNALLISEIGFEFGKDGNKLLIKFLDVESEIALGNGEWRMSEFSFFLDGWVSMNLGSKVAASAIWEKDNILRIMLRHLETPFCMHFVCIFEEDRLVLQPRVNVSFGPTVYPDIMCHII